MSGLSVELFKQTEQVELIFYALYGLIVASAPFLMRLFSVGDANPKRLVQPYAAFSYYIGRSHDYNIRPLIPFFSLILLAMFSNIYPKFIRYFSMATVCLIVSWTMIEQYHLEFSGLKTFQFSGSGMNTKFTEYREDPETSDLGRAIAHINEVYAEPAIVVDPVSTVTISGNQLQWNAYNNMASYNYLPNPMQKEFIARSKNKLMRTGWVLVHDNMGIFGVPFILDLFQYSYVNDETLTFGEYTALRFVPIPG